MSQTDGQQTLDILLIEPEEDSGSDTQDRYGWQHHCTVNDCLQLLGESGVTAVICEFHEDYVVVRGEGRELVSCKHREANQGPWSLTALCQKGGLAHLFARWASSPTSSARLVTSAGLKMGVGEAHEFMLACARASDGGLTAADWEIRDSFARALLTARRSRKHQHIPKTPTPPRGTVPLLDTDFQDRVGEFMGVLKIRAEAPARRYIHQVQEPTVTPVLEGLGYPPGDAGPCYQAVLDIVAARNRIGRLTGRYAEWITGQGDDAPGARLAALREARTIRPGDVEAAIRNARGRAGRPGTEQNAQDRLRAKMVAGGIGATRIMSGVRYRDLWLRAWAGQRTGVPGDLAAKEQLELRVLEIAGDVEAELLSSSGAHWGNAMYTTLRTRLKPVRQLGFDLGPDELMGVVMDLAAQCEVWFSPEFDVDAALRDADVVGA